LNALRIKKIIALTALEIVFVALPVTSRADEVQLSLQPFKQCLEPTSPLPRRWANIKYAGFDLGQDFLKVDFTGDGYCDRIRLLSWMNDEVLRKFEPEFKNYALIGGRDRWQPLPIKKLQTPLLTPSYNTEEFGGFDGKTAIYGFNLQVVYSNTNFASYVIMAWPSMAGTHPEVIKDSDGIAVALWSKKDQHFKFVSVEIREKVIKFVRALNLPLLFAFLKPAWLSCLFRRGSRPFCFKLHGAHVIKTRV
jgi:hypothetical protein